MSLKIGIVGLPNVGKSTFFSAITNSSVEIANYPFSTIKPNVGIVEVKDKRLDYLAKYFNPNRVIYTTFEFIDIAGLIKGASNGEGLGNKFLANIAATDAICQVVRCFESKNITHVDGSVDSVRDVEVINLELILHDQNLIEQQILKFKKKLKNNIFPELQKKLMLLYTVKKYLEANKLLNQYKFTNEERTFLKEFNLLTIKPFIYLANINENDLAINTDNDHVKRLKEYANKQNIKVIKLCVEFEFQISQMDSETKLIFMDEYNVKNTGLEELILESYSLLGLQTFFTVGADEVRGWTFSKGMYASQCAGIIHSDFEKKFIKADIYNYNDFLVYKSEKIIKEKGKVRIEGKNYLMQDGDICYFRCNK